MMRQWDKVEYVSGSLFSDRWAQIFDFWNIYLEYVYKNDRIS